MAQKERTFHTKITLMGNNGSVSNNKNVTISPLQNHNHKIEYRIMNPIPIKDKNNTGTRVTNKIIQCNKESISISNTYKKYRTYNNPYMKRYNNKTIIPNTNEALKKSYQNTTPTHNNRRTQM